MHVASCSGESAWSSHLCVGIRITLFHARIDFEAIQQFLAGCLHHIIKVDAPSSVLQLSFILNILVDRVLFSRQSRLLDFSASHLLHCCGNRLK